VAVDPAETRQRQASVRDLSRRVRDSPGFSPRKLQTPERFALNFSSSRWLCFFGIPSALGIFILAPMVGRRSPKDVSTDEPSEDATTEGQRTLYGFRAVYEET
jgi:hypothetical protein